MTQILSKAKQLRNSVHFKHVYISPDRTLEERTLHRDLVQQLKSKRQHEPGKRHYIKGGQLLSYIVSIRL